MSVKVDIAELAGHVASYGPAYLLTVTDDQRAHAVMVRPTLHQDDLVLDGLGARTRANLAARPDVTLLWPPVTEGGHSLIVDGRAVLSDDGARVTPGHAVLHRPADHAPGGHGSAGASCGNDCVAVAEA